MAVDRASRVGIHVERSVFLLLLLAVFLLVLAAIPPLAAVRAAAAEPQALPWADDAGLREMPGGPRPLEVRVGVFVNNLVHVDQSDGTFEITGYLYASWIDPRLVFDPGRVGQTRLTGRHSADLWVPRLELVNAQRTVVTGEYTTVEHIGRVEYFRSFESRLSADFDLRFFPFDRQTLRIVVEPFDLAAEDVVLLPDERTGGVNPERYARLPEWRLLSFTQAATRAPFAPDGENYSRLSAELALQRQFSFYFWNVFAPILFFNVISWTAFWMNPSRWFNNQLTVCISSMLFMITFSFVIKAGLPRVAYLTFVDGLIFVSYTCVFLSLVATVAIHHTLDRGREAAAQVWQARMRRIMPALFVLTNAVLVGLLIIDS